MTITLFFLQASRAIRTAWHLEELGLDYNVEASDRKNKVAPPEYRKKMGGLGKSPTIIDNGNTIVESGNIAEYLEEKYDKEHKLLSADIDTKYQTLRWVHAAEATYMLHALPLVYVQWFGNGYEEAQKAIAKGISKNVLADIDHLEEELGKINGKFLMGDNLTVADINMHFTVQLMWKRQLGVTQDLGVERKGWTKIEQWLRDCEATEGYQRAVKKTGYDLDKSG